MTLGTPPPRLRVRSQRLPPWLKTQIPVGPDFNRIRTGLRKLKLSTVRTVPVVSVLISC